ncbi:MAG: hypothetical protein GPJ54_20955 [Candidatus Heimdallarchaeota archaeon]|nr:hypothetical protein [Candidatus Heimdallarchaeota archaeon]
MSLSIRRHVVYYSSVAAGGYGDVCILLAEHTRKLTFQIIHNRMKKS